MDILALSISIKLSTAIIQMFNLFSKLNRCQRAVTDLLGMLSQQELSLLSILTPYALKFEISRSISNPMARLPTFAFEGTSRLYSMRRKRKLVLLSRTLIRGMLTYVTTSHTHSFNFYFCQLHANCVSIHGSKVASRL